MTSTAVPRTGARASFAGALAIAGASAFALSSAWYALALLGITVASEPTLPATVLGHERDQIFSRWVVSTLPQERAYTALAIAGFCCLAGVVALLRSRVGDGALSATAGARAAFSGARR